MAGAASVSAAGGRASWWRTRGSLPGFGLSLGITITYLSLLVLIPLSGLVWKTASLGLPELARAVLSPRALAAYRLSFGAALVAGIVNVVFGLVLAWVLTR
jgi:sulfate/thiosulfate transport system permease protein